MTIKHFCHVCNVKFHRAIDFMTHSHKEIKDVLTEFTPKKKEGNGDDSLQDR